MARSGGGARLISLVVIALLPTAVGTDRTREENLDREENSLDSARDSFRWEVHEFEACSVQCGGGIQARTIRCVRTPSWHGDDSEASYVPGTFCPLPAPAVTRSCNNHMCSAHWTKGKWSECSQTCGVGTQTRDVKCENSLWHEQSYQVSPSECGGSKPETSRKCHLKDCPFGEKLETYSILAENYTLIQLYRSKKIKVKIGGEVNLLPRQTVVVKCPVKHYSRKLVYWSKGYKLVSFMGRVRSTAGGLLIRKADPETDAGVYTCIAGDKTATVTVNFISKDDPVSKLYKKWMRKAKRQHQKHPSKYKNNGGIGNDVLISPANTSPDELNQQRDQSQNASHSLAYVSDDWSECSAACGSQGHRKRKVSCSHVTPKYVKIVPDAECNRVGLVKPETTQECSAGQKCPVWRPGPWTKCRPSCGKSGNKIRILTCVWEETGENAWNACDVKKRPATSKPCKTRPCPKECTDGSRYCSLARMLNMCRFVAFRRQCCHTCHKLPNIIS